jgi:TRAP-type C4-dicarboxylate transport system permease small subunit
MTPPPVMRALDGIAVVLALVAGVAVAVLSVLIVFDIVARSLFRFSLQGTDELGGYTLALTGSLGLAYTLMRRGHPRIDIGFRFFPSRMRQVLHVLALAALTGFALFMTQHAVDELRGTLAFGTITNTPLQTPLWVPQIFWVAGTGFFALTALLMTLHGALMIMSGRGAEAERVYGPLTVDEELDEYLRPDASPHDGPTGREL